VPLWWWAGQVIALYWPLISWLAWARPATVVADTAGKGSDLASVRVVGVGSSSHWGGGNVR
jgi:hypothetical protein